MLLHSIKPKKGPTKGKKRVGRGNSSGHGTYSGRGSKGTGQHRGGNLRPGFEGGQTPLIMRLPKLKGFKNPNKVHFQVVNVKDLECFNDGDEVNILTLLEKKLIRRKDKPVKILGHGNLAKKLNIKVHKISAVAKDKILKAGGKVL